MIRYFLKLFGASKLGNLTDAQRTILASFTQDSRFLTSPSWNPPHWVRRSARDSGRE